MNFAIFHLQFKLFLKSSIILVSGTGDGRSNSGIVSRIHFHTITLEIFQQLWVKKNCLQVGAVILRERQFYIENQGKKGTIVLPEKPRQFRDNKNTICDRPCQEETTN